MFLTKDELKSAAVPEVVDRAINQDDEVVTIIINESIAEMKSYLSGRFDVATIFAETEADRDQVVLKHLKKIVVDEIYRRKTGEINETTEKGYNEAMYWLKEVAAGHIPAGDLPPKVAEPETGDGFIKFGGNTRYNSNY
ncbi:hypothetical protein BFP77_08290 [Maribacter sp. 4U21]|uniref:phage protein Gp36 family protein n=1 Tax=Maribacter sp. 4U21 TaxID=1889779 RepID=UPI000C1545C3|nr:phage protein Gp36 family protein [Maribacter sp. 4U21]PIB28906.1 hypothetical protein BFP77_08290 [Maribacter sp. 4U21]